MEEKKYYTPNDKVYDFLEEQRKVDSKNIINPIYKSEQLLPNTFIYDYSIRDIYSLEHMIYNVFFNHKGMLYKEQQCNFMNYITMNFPSKEQALQLINYHKHNTGLIFDIPRAKSILLAQNIAKDIDSCYIQDGREHIYGYLFDYRINKIEEVCINKNNYIFFNNLCIEIHKAFNNYRTIITYQKTYTYNYGYCNIDPVPMIRVFVTNRTRYKTRTTLSKNLYAAKLRLVETIHYLFSLYGIDYDSLYGNSLMSDYYISE